MPREMIFAATNIATVNARPSLGRSIWMHTLLMSLKVFSGSKTGFTLIACASKALVAGIVTPKINSANHADFHSGYADRARFSEERSREPRVHCCIGNRGRGKRLDWVPCVSSNAELLNVPGAATGSIPSGAGFRPNDDGLFPKSEFKPDAGGIEEASTPELAPQLRYAVRQSKPTYQHLNHGVRKDSSTGVLGWCMEDDASQGSWRSWSLRARRDELCDLSRYMEDDGSQESWRI